MENISPLVQESFQRISSRRLNAIHLFFFLYFRTHFDIYNFVLKLSKAKIVTDNMSYGDGLKYI